MFSTAVLSRGRDHITDPVSQVQALCDHLGSLVGSLDPEILHGSQAASLVETFSKIERFGSAGRTLAARAAQRTGSWKTHGDRSAAHWMARTAGVPVGQAVASLETASRLHELEELDSALREGKLSSLQANEVASAAAADPSSQRTLLAKAATQDLSALKDTARKIKAAAQRDEIEHYRAIHRRRYLRHWNDPDGSFRLDGRFTPDAGAKLLANLDPFRQEVFRSARKAGTREPYDAYSADALVAMSAAAHQEDPIEPADDGGHRPPGRPRPATARTVINVHVDHAALVRGHTEPGETCEIPGVGPIPVAVARQMANDAYLKVIVTDGADIKAIAHAGRTIPAHIRTALETRDPTCCVPGCNTRKGLEIDHIVPFAEGGPTKLDNLARLCHWHHRQKSLGDWRIEGTPGDWRWVPGP